MKLRTAAILLVVAIAAVLMLRLWSSRYSPLSETPPAEEASSNPDAVALSTNSSPVETVSAPASEPLPAVPKPATVSPPVATVFAETTNKLERLAQIREYFSKLAAGDRIEAIRSAKGITNAVEREVALVTLVTEWTGGNLRDPRQRALAITQFGLEAGLGIELAKDPERALQWANELPPGDGRNAIIREVAAAMLASDPARAFSYSEEIPQKEREAFFTDLYARWAARDTDAALAWAGQLSDAADRDAALDAIRTTAPVGIGVALKMQDGYPSIDNLVKGGPAELNGQIHNGDRIVALAQGDSSFIDAHDLKLDQLVKMIRGDPGTTLQLQVLASDAPAGSTPRTVSITRDQIRFKTN